MTQAAIVTVTAGYSQEYYPSSGQGMLRGSSKTVARDYKVSLRDLGSAVAPSLARLRFVGGESIVLRLYEGRTYRPVLGPGTLSPLDVEGFERACAGQESWRDDPFRKNDYHGDGNRPPRPSVGDMDRDGPFDYRKLGTNDSAQVDEGLQRRAADLVVIDGIVHVECPQPVLTLKTAADVNDKATRNVLTWSLPGLEGDDDPASGPSCLTPIPYQERARGPERGYAPRQAPFQKRRDFTGSTWRRFDLLDLAPAHAFAVRLSELQGLPFDCVDDLVEVHAPELVHAREPLRPGVAARAFHKAVGSDLEHYGRPFVEAWLDARDALRDGREAEAAALLHRAATALPDGPPRNGGISWLGHSIDAGFGEGPASLVRYVMVDSVRAPANPFPIEDDEALTALAPAF